VSEASVPAGPRWQAQCGIGVALLLVAAALWFDARHLPASPAVGVGPTAAMRLVAAIVAVLGQAHIV
jgi:putative tricarboxylic transport membrane protein